MAKEATAAVQADAAPDTDSSSTRARVKPIRKISVVGDTWRELRIQLDVGQTLDHLEAALVGSPIENQIVPGDILQVLNADCTTFAQYYVAGKSVGRSFTLVELFRTELPLLVSPIQSTGLHYARWSGPEMRWQVIGPTGLVLQSGILNELQAVQEAHQRNVRQPTGAPHASMRK